MTHNTTVQWRFIHRSEISSASTAAARSSVCASAFTLGWCSSLGLQKHNTWLTHLHMFVSWWCVISYMRLGLCVFIFTFLLFLNYRVTESMWPCKIQHNPSTVSLRLPVVCVCVCLLCLDCVISSGREFKRKFWLIWAVCVTPLHLTKKKQQTNINRITDDP